MHSGPRSRVAAFAISVVATAAPVVTICAAAAAARTAGLAHLREAQYAAIAAAARPAGTAPGGGTQHAAPPRPSSPQPGGFTPTGTSVVPPRPPRPAPTTSTTAPSPGAAVTAPIVPLVINTPQDFALALLNALGDPVTSQNTKAIVSWEQAEGGAWGSPARYNPLNTTRTMPGSYAINGAGVQAYTSWTQGLAATVQTLDSGMYGRILAALKAGNSDQAVERAVAGSAWGTGSFLLIP